MHAGRRALEMGRMSPRNFLFFWLMGGRPAVSCTSLNSTQAVPQRRNGPCVLELHVAASCWASECAETGTAVTSLASSRFSVPKPLIHRRNTGTYSVQTPESQSLCQISYRIYCSFTPPDRICNLARTPAVVTEVGVDAEIVVHHAIRPCKSIYMYWDGPGTQEHSSIICRGSMTPDMHSRGPSTAPTYIEEIIESIRTFSSQINAMH
jgi:hypothetical protein